ncbi:hypothetical protein J2067_000708 [Erwinia rhapontici]|nr:hypothetical protein [Erwinia rhapontici]
MSFSEFPSQFYFDDTVVFHCCFGGLTPTFSPLTWAPCSVASRPLVMLRLLPAFTVVSLCVAPLPVSLPRPLLTLALSDSPLAP